MRDDTLHERVVLLLDEELDPEDRQALTALIEQDEESRLLLQDMKRIWSLMDHYTPIPVSRDLSGQVMEQVRAEVALEYRSKVIRLTISWAAAAAIFLAVFLGLPGNQKSKESSGGAGSFDDYSTPLASYYDFEDF